MDLIVVIIIVGIINLLWGAFWGVVPPFLIGCFMLKKSQLLVEEAKQIRAELPGILKGKGVTMTQEVIEYLGSEDFMFRIKQMMDGAAGREVRKVKDAIINEHDLSGMPAPVVDVIAKGASGYVKDYFGVPRKVFESALRALFRKKVDPAQSDANVLNVANELGIDVRTPEMREKYLIP